MKKKSLALALLLVVSVVMSACSNYQFKPTTSYEISDFTATDHRGEEVSLESLKGEPWLAMFIFTNCTTICSPMTYNMSLIQEDLVKKGIEDYKIVAFSVDPANDSPEVLSEYLNRFNVPDESKWHLVTGYDQKFIEQLAVGSFKSLVKAIEGEDQVMHANTFYLVDEKGVAVKNYTGYSQTEDGVPYDTIAVDLQSLIEERLGK
ncbi:cytochrome c oxidase assembly protein [Solibacillus sp. R5-41]|uniref:SCO family protein n=1 Tax=Solibacillus sp. R5-41 TaxID=2048654 RepID=UPI000C12882D|nr:SCO family protein [Solibacillus sp. R5-41]ATP40558.1 cytochrome c oxidase assembly protein [Solibacillus sp. R5-41]